MLCIERLGVLYGGKYQGCPWYPRILCIEGFGGLYGGKYLGIPIYYVLRDWGVYMEGCTWDVLGIQGYYVLRG